MDVALALGRRGLGRTAPNPAVGALVVRHDTDGSVVVGRGWTQPGGRPHAETQALRQAGSAARGATLYVSLEPCCHEGATPPCTDAIIAAGIATVVTTIDDPNPAVAGKGRARLRAAGIEVRPGVLVDAARRAHAGHIRRMTDGRPHVLLKLAVSTDGKVGLAGRRPAAITGDRARDRVHLMRAMSDAILIGIGTAISDDPALTCRLPGMAARSPVRIVLDSELRLPLDGRLALTARDTPVWVVAAATAANEKAEALVRCGCKILRCGETRPGRLDLGALVRMLGERGITRLMVEGGPTVAAAFLEGDLVDELVLLRSDSVIGAEGIDALSGLPLDALIRPKALRSLGRTFIGPDTLETFVRT